ncbi:hypothetical protein SBA4_1600013 [Candidatus Sulfopaludibacter sp. SbA4]|nr:hypothetical protein SBA4_1600013 [Candidatus Sulfopaludibacter sp. SbA4]
MIGAGPRGHPVRKGFLKWGLLAAGPPFTALTPVFRYPKNLES